MIKTKSLLEHINTFLIGAPTNEKLVRDMIPEMSKHKADGGLFRQPKDLKELRKFLSLKVLEESMEVVGEISDMNISKLRITEELGDLLEVIDAIQDHFQIRTIDIVNRQMVKRQHKGQFKDNAIMKIGSRKE